MDFQNCLSNPLKGIIPLNNPAMCLISLIRMIICRTSETFVWLLVMEGPKAKKHFSAIFKVTAQVVKIYLWLCS